MNKSVAFTLGSLLVASISWPALGAPIPGTAGYTKLWSRDNSRPQFSELEQLGVRKAAEDNAVQDCYSAGHTLCYPQSSQTMGCNYSGGVDEGQAVIHCDASAIAIGN
jgi:hypothetical protein